MTKGRKPTPASLKVVTGNPGKRPIKHGLAAENEAPPPPDRLSAEALEIWHSTVPQLHRLGVLARVDQHQIAVYCEVVARYYRALGEVQRLGEVYETQGKNGPMLRVNPYVKIARDCEVTIKNYASEWGMTAVARMRLGDPKQPDLFGDDPTAL